MKKLNFIFLALSCFVCLNSCKKNNFENQENVTVTKDSFTWYAFTDSDFVKVEKPISAPVVVQKPWTEAVRISDMSSSYSVDEKKQVAYAILNRVGLIIFDNEKIELLADSIFFDNKTAGNLVFYKNYPVFLIYTSSFFNKENKSFKYFNPFLVHFSPTEYVIYPVLNVANLGLQESYEITDFVWDGKIFNFCAKSTEKEKIDFLYLNVQLKEDLLAINPQNADKAIFVTQSDSDSFRNSQKKLDFENAPERLKDLLNGITKKSSFEVDCYTLGGVSPRSYEFNKNSINENEKVLNANAILADYWCAVLFEDGTMFFKGALFSEHILNQGKTIAIKLPKLPKEFVYSGFAITGNYLYCAWEETSFYKTGRSGFISVNLKKIIGE